MKARCLRDRKVGLLPSLKDGQDLFPNYRASCSLNLSHSGSIIRRKRKFPLLKKYKLKEECTSKKSNTVPVSVFIHKPTQSIRWTPESDSLLSDSSFP